MIQKSVTVDFAIGHMQEKLGKEWAVPHLRYAWVKDERRNNKRSSKVHWC